MSALQFSLSQLRVCTRDVCSFLARTESLAAPPTPPTMSSVRDYIFAKYDFHPTEEAAGQRVELAQTAPPIGMLFVTAVRASNLKNRDSGINGDVSDPFVQIKLGTQSVKSAWVKDTLDPQWDMKLDPLQWNGLELMQIQVWDYDKHTGNDSLGQAVVCLEGIPDSGKDEAGAQLITLALHGSHALPSSTVTLKLNFQDLHQW